MKKREFSGIILILLGIYTVLVVWIILFKMALSVDIQNMGHIRNINLVPFNFGQNRSFLRADALRNVLIFIPVGIYLKMLKVSGVKAALFGMGFSVLLEVLQFLLGVGATDITDMITNTAGAILGVMIYGFLACVFRKRKTLDKMLTAVATVCTVLLLSVIALILL